MVAARYLGSELNRLTALFLALCENDRHHRDYTRHEAHEVSATMARLPVYRTYFASRAKSPLKTTCKCPSRSTPPKPLGSTWTPIVRLPERNPCADLRDQFYTELALGFQQLTGSVMAKALEDTAFYRYNRMICLNEVGGDPARFGITVEEFHRASQDRRRWSQGLLATTTHDTKRSEDVRAR